MLKVLHLDESVIPTVRNHLEICRACKPYITVQQQQKNYLREIKTQLAASGTDLFGMDAEQIGTGVNLKCYPCRGLLSLCIRYDLVMAVLYCWSSPTRGLNVDYFKKGICCTRFIFTMISDWKNCILWR